jgi:hypothetical protein
VKEYVESVKKTLELPVSSEELKKLRESVSERVKNLDVDQSKKLTEVLDKISEKATEVI